MISKRCLTLACSLFFAAEAYSNSDDTVTVKGIRTGISANNVRVVLDLSGAAEYKVLELAQPRRLLVELAHTELATDINQREFAGTIISDVRTSAKADSTDLVFELSSEGAIKAFPLKPYLDKGHRLVIDFSEPGLAQDSNQTAGLSPALAAQQQPVASTRKQSRRGSNRKSRPRQKTSPLEISGTWSQEWAVTTNDGSTQKFEAVVEPRIDLVLPNNMHLTGIARVRGDTENDLGPDASRPENYSDINGPWFNNAHGEFSLRELYLDARWGGGFWRIGKQQVVWGQADGVKVMDVVNPQSYREFIMDDLDDSRIPLWMINVEYPVGPDGNLQFLWIPDTTYHELAETGTPYAFTSSRLVPVAPAGLPTVILDADKPDNAFSDSDAGLRYSAFLGGWDVTLNYLYQYQNFPVPYQELRLNDGDALGVVTPRYKRNHLLGGTFSNVFGNFTLRSELVYNSDSYVISSDLSERGIANSKEFSSVLGLDWQLGSYDTLLSAQWFQRHLLDYNSNIKPDQTEHNLSLLYRRTFANETWTLDALGLYSPNHGDRWVQLRLSYLFRSNLEIWLGGDFFGGDKNGVYGEFSGADRVLVGMELGL